MQLLGGATSDLHSSLPSFSLPNNGPTIFVEGWSYADKHQDKPGEMVQ
jgi:hypothetical protein